MYLYDMADGFIIRIEKDEMNRISPFCKQLYHRINMNYWPSKKSFALVAFTFIGHLYLQRIVIFTLGRFQGFVWISLLDTLREEFT